MFPVCIFRLFACFFFCCCFCCLLSWQSRGRTVVGVFCPELLAVHRDLGFAPNYLDVISLDCSAQVFSHWPSYSGILKIFSWPEFLWGPLPGSCELASWSSWWVPSESIAVLPPIGKAKDGVDLSSVRLCLLCQHLTYSAVTFPHLLWSFFKIPQPCKPAVASVRVFIQMMRIQVLAAIFSGPRACNTHALPQGRDPGWNCYTRNMLLKLLKCSLGCTLYHSDFRKLAVEQTFFTFLKSATPPEGDWRYQICHS